MKMLVFVLSMLCVFQNSDPPYKELKKSGIIFNANKIIYTPTGAKKVTYTVKPYTVLLRKTGKYPALWIWPVVNDSIYSFSLYKDDTGKWIPEVHN